MSAATSRSYTIEAHLKQLEVRSIDEVPFKIYDRVEWQRSAEAAMTRTGLGLLVFPLRKITEVDPDAELYPWDSVTLVKDAKQLEFKQQEEELPGATRGIAWVWHTRLTDPCGGMVEFADSRYATLTETNKAPCCMPGECEDDLTPYCRRCKAGSTNLCGNYTQANVPITPVWVYWLESKWWLVERAAVLFGIIIFICVLFCVFGCTIRMEEKPSEKLSEEELAIVGDQMRASIRRSQMPRAGLGSRLVLKGVVQSMKHDDRKPNEEVSPDHGSQEREALLKRNTTYHSMHSLFDEQSRDVEHMLTTAVKDCLRYPPDGKYAGETTLIRAAAQGDELWVRALLEKHEDLSSGNKGTGSREKYKLFTLLRAGSESCIPSCSSSDVPLHPVLHQISAFVLRMIDSCREICGAWLEILEKSACFSRVRTRATSCVPCSCCVVGVFFWCGFGGALVFGLLGAFGVIGRMCPNFARRNALPAWAVQVFERPVSSMCAGLRSQISCCIIKRNAAEVALEEGHYTVAILISVRQNLEAHDAWLWIPWTRWAWFTFLVVAVPAFVGLLLATPAGDYVWSAMLSWLETSFPEYWPTIQFLDWGRQKGQEIIHDLVLDLVTTYAPGEIVCTRKWLFWEECVNVHRDAYDKQAAVWEKVITIVLGVISIISFYVAACRVASRNSLDRARSLESKACRELKARKIREENCAQKNELTDSWVRVADANISNTVRSYPKVNPCHAFAAHSLPPFRFQGQVSHAEGSLPERSNANPPAAKSSETTKAKAVGPMEKAACKSKAQPLALPSSQNSQMTCQSSSASAIAAKRLTRARQSRALLAEAQAKAADANAKRAATRVSGIPARRSSLLSA